MLADFFRHNTDVKELKMNSEETVELPVMRVKKRSKRRHNIERLKKKRINYHGGYAKKAQEDGDIEFAEQCSGKWTNTSTPCSCWMCGNPRKYMKQKLTIQEQKAPKIQEFVQ